MSGNDGGSGGTVSDAGGSGGSGGSGGTSDGGTGGNSITIDCNEDADCENASMVCDPLLEQCVECLFDSDCDTGERCEARACVDSVNCSSSTDCIDVEGAEACDTTQGHCVQCVYAGDCPGTADCIAHKCRPYLPCSNSLDCPDQQVCNTSTFRCVQCVSDNDCDDGLSCAANSCRRSCTSDNDCTPLGFLCDFSTGACTRCLSDTDCPDVYHCDTGRCMLDECKAGSGYCDSNALYSCTSAGDGYAYVGCSSSQTCTGGAEASCKDWVCTPGATECNAAGTAVVTCSDDGLSIESSTNCADSDQVCYQATCQDLECAPYTYFCDENTVRYCYYDGLSSTLITTCASDQYCDPESPSCVDLLCEPDAPACNGTIATACNSAGDGYENGGTDCADTDQFCADGVCRDCNGSVLLLGDSDTTGNALMQTALEDAGLVVTLINSGVASYAGSPDAADFGVVVSSIGVSYNSNMPQAGQDSIVAAHAAGTGFLTHELAAYQYGALGYNATLAQLLLIQYGTLTTTTQFTLTQSNHPIWEGLSTSLTTSSVYAVGGPLINSGVAIATCLNCDNAGAYPGAGVAVREGDGGRIVQLAHAGNYSTAFSDAGLLKMFVNATEWAAGCK